ncbi:MerR family transcriptional regulator [Pseudonocardia acaciae]|uniref:MerR family transcriptional regulator n=1 Tax=Pseudonocardia acaciae TaxID=551276 RepID=UPI00316AC702
MAELSAASGVPIATIKYYLREGLLPAGERTSPNQANYTDAHVRRLKLVRALLDVGGLSVASVREVLTAIDHQISTHKVLGIAQHGLPLPKAGVDERSREWALGVVERIAEERGWKLKPGHVVVEALVGTLCTFAELGKMELVERIDEYAELADRLAELDLSTLRDLTSIESLVEGAVVGTVLGDVLIATLRRLAQQHASALTYGLTGEA